MDIRKIRKLIELLKETGISEIEIKEGEESLRLTCYHQTAASAPRPIVNEVVHLPVHTEAVQESKPSIQGHQICSPMVGTMYTAPSPDTQDFV